MRIVFMGTPDLSAHVLQRLIEAGYEIAAVVTQQDKPQGRHAKLVASPVKQLALNHLPLDRILQPFKAREPAFIEQLAALQPDLLVVAAYGQILPQQILDIPPLGCINVHYSLLPKLRGAAPIQRAIAQGYSQTGVTIMRMVLQMDAGAILAQKAIDITESTTTGELREQLTQLSGPLLLDVIEQLRAGSCKEQEQDSSQMTLAPKIDSAQAEIDWNLDAQHLQRWIRAMDPEPGAWCWMQLRGQRKRVKCFEPMLEPDIELNLASSHEKIAAGTLLSMGPRLRIATGRGTISLGRVQPEGKPMMSAKAFSSGYQIQDIILNQSFSSQ